MNEIPLLLSVLSTQSGQVTDYDALATKLMLEMPVGQMILIGLIACVSFVIVFFTIFMIVSKIISISTKIRNKYYEKTGKKPPIKKYHKTR